MVEESCAGGCPAKNIIKPKKEMVKRPIPIDSKSLTNQALEERKEDILDSGDWEHIRTVHSKNFSNTTTIVAGDRIILKITGTAGPLPTEGVSIVGNVWSISKNGKVIPNASPKYFYSHVYNGYTGLFDTDIVLWTTNTSSASNRYQWSITVTKQGQASHNNTKGYWAEVWREKE